MYMANLFIWLFWLSVGGVKFFSSCCCYHRFHFYSLQALYIFYIHALLGIKSRLEIVMLLSFSPSIEAIRRVGNAYVKKNLNSESSLVSFYFAEKDVLPPLNTNFLSFHFLYVQKISLNEIRLVKIFFNRFGIFKHFLCGNKSNN